MEQCVNYNSRPLRLGGDVHSVQVQLLSGVFKCSAINPNPTPMVCFLSERNRNTLWLYLSDD